MIPLVGYTNRSSARPGEAIEVKVSSSAAEPYEVDFVRLLSADPNPEGCGVRYREVAAEFTGHHPSRQQESRLGSYGLAEPVDTWLADPWTFSVRVQPWLLDDRSQVAVQVQGTLGFSVCLSEAATVLEFEGGEKVALPALALKRWHEVRVVLQQDAVTFMHLRLDRPGPVQQTTIKPPRSSRGVLTRLVLGACWEAQTQRAARFFNGRLEDPAILAGVHLQQAALAIDMIDGASVRHWWDFSAGISGDGFHDRAEQGTSGRFVNLPTRGVCGSRWSGGEMNWMHAPRDYAAVHFHEDDLYDCSWETDFVARIPDGLESGIYGIRLRCGRNEDVIPVYVLPARQAARKHVALLVPTFTYQVYANFDRANFDAAYRQRRADWGAYPHHPAEHREYGYSTYDRHRDGSGVALSSRRRPVLTDRPGYLAYVDAKGSGIRHLSADMHLVDWLMAHGIEFDVVTDHDLHKEGAPLIADHRCLLTGTHPEYHTPQTLDALQGYVDGGGKLVYLGGNGFYWKVGISEEVPDVLEVRRAEAGTRAWASDPGEYYHMLDGAYGGLWRRNRRPPQQLVGVGMTAQGYFEGTYYRRRPESYMTELAWMFDGIEDERIGDFGLSGGGAAGFELDRADVELGTPANAVVVASSENHPAHFGVTPEEVLSTLPHIGGGGSADLIRADMTYFETPGGGAVFSVGSITFCGSLPCNGYANNVSRLLKNVIGRFAGLDIAEARSS